MLSRIKSHLAPRSAAACAAPAVAVATPAATTAAVDDPDDDGLPDSVRRCLAHKSTLKVVHPQVNVESFVDRCRARGIDFWLTVDMVDDMYRAHCRLKTVNLAPLNPGRMREILQTLPGVTRVRERPNRPEHHHLVDEIGLDPKEKAIMFRVAPLNAASNGVNTAKTAQSVPVPRRDLQPPADRVGKPGQEWSRSGLELVAKRPNPKKPAKSAKTADFEPQDRVLRVA